MEVPEVCLAKMDLLASSASLRGRIAFGLSLVCKLKFEL